MPELPHLILPRAEVNLNRRKRPGFGRSVPREPGEHATRISQAVDEALATHAILRATIVDPELIVRVRTTHFLPEDEWIRVGLTVLGHDDNGHYSDTSRESGVVDSKAISRCAFCVLIQNFISRSSPCEMRT